MVMDFMFLRYTFQGWGLYWCLMKEILLTLPLSVPVKRGQWISPQSSREEELPHPEQTDIDTTGAPVRAKCQIPKPVSLFLVSRSQMPDYLRPAPRARLLSPEMAGPSLETQVDDGFIIFVYTNISV